MPPGITYHDLKVLCEAAPFFNIDMHWNERKTVVLVGEARIGGLAEWNAGMALLNRFSLRGLEALPTRKKWYRSAKGVLKLLAMRVSQGLERLRVEYEDYDRGSLVQAAHEQGYFFYADVTQDVSYFNGHVLGPESVPEVVRTTNLSSYVINYHLERDRQVLDALEKSCGSGVTMNVQKCDKKILFDARSEAMVSSIVEGLNLFADRPKMAVVVGFNHVPGMSHSLSCKHGFKSVAVSRLFKMESYPEAVAMDGRFCEWPD
jgi:hypothetical protein